MEIFFPNSAFLGNIESFLFKLNTKNRMILNVSFNQKWVSVHPVVLCMTAAISLAIRQGGARVESHIFKTTAKSLPYFIRMKLFDFLRVNPDSYVFEHDATGRFIPLSQINNASELTKFIADVIPLLHLSPQEAEPIRYVLSEVTRNVFEHSNSSIGAIVCAQYFKKSNKISLGVVDYGMGIKRSINVSHPANSDLEAIKLALYPGVTGTTTRMGGTEFNAGAGLFFTKSIAKVNRNFFMIYSGDAMYKLKKTPAKKEIVLYPDSTKDPCSLREGLPYWQGTVVGIDISLAINEPFSVLLSKLRKAYSLDVKKRRKEKYKKAIFI